MSKFKFLDRAAKDTILLIPGWATDHRIFDTLDIGYNYILPIESSPFDFCEGLTEAMEENGVKKISVLGWSMGGFIACDVLSKYRDRVAELILVGVRRRDDKTNNENIKKLLEKNKKGFLRKFYKDCLPKDGTVGDEWFRTGLLKDYIEEMELSRLIEGLDYLSEHRIEPVYLEGSKVTFVHGLDDKIAPIKEAMELKDYTPRSQFISMEGVGHMPFLAPEFEKVLCR